MDELTKNERVINVLKKNEVDRPPVSMWKHFFKEENSSNELAESMLSFQNKFNWDFMKVNPRFSYHTEDWGVKMKTYNDSFKSPDKIEYPIKQKSDWNKIKYLDINKGVLGEHLESLKIQTRSYFSGNILAHPGYIHMSSEYGDMDQTFANAQLVTTNSFFLGTYVGLTDAKITYIKDAVDDFFGKLK